MFQGLREGLINWLLPQPWSVYRGVEVFRCEADGCLLTDAVCRGGERTKKIRERHIGHRFRSPVVLTKREKLLIWLKVIQ